MYLLQVLCIFLTVALIDADCPYAAEVTKLEACDKNQPQIFTIPPSYSINLVSDRCDVEVTGCALVLQDVKTITVKWTAWHNKNQVHTGSKEGCGYEFGKMVVKCPVKKGTKICAKSEIVKNPVGAPVLAMFLGNLKIKFDVITEKGVTQCMMGYAKLFKK